MDFDQQISDLRSQLHALDRIAVHLARLTTKKNKLERRQQQLQLKVEKEYVDYKDAKDQYEKAIINLFLLPDEEKLEKEKEEYFEAVLALNKAEKELSLLGFETDILEEKLSKRPGIQEQLQKLQTERERKLMGENTDLRLLQQKLDLLDANMQVLKTINDKSQECNVRLKEIIGSLQQIELSKHTIRNKRSREKTIMRELNRIHQHLSVLKIKFAMMEAGTLAYTGSSDSDTAEIPDWEGMLHPLRDFSDKFFVRLANKGQLNRDFVKGKNQVVQLQYHLEGMIKENNFRLRDLMNERKEMQVAKAHILGTAEKND